MKYGIKPRYRPITELPYCCVPAVLQMVLERRKMPCGSQEEIGYELGLIVPPELESRFTKVKVGPEPRAGYGTQTSKQEFSISSYFRRNRIPLNMTTWKPTSAGQLKDLLIRFLLQGDDVIVCYNSQLLFGSGDVEHVSLIQSVDTETEEVWVVDPAVGVPKHRRVSLAKLSDVLVGHEVSEHGGLWVISSMEDKMGNWRFTGFQAGC